MKTLLLLTYSFCFQCTWAQNIELSGSYGASFIGGERINFTGADSFYFSGFYCTNGVSGKGVCEIKDGFLYLYFSKEKTPEKLLPPAPVITKDPVTASQNKIVFQLFDTGRVNAVAYLTIAQKNSKRGAITDINGSATFNLAATGFPVTFNISGAGFETCEIKIKEPGSYHVTAYMQHYNLLFKALNKGEIYTYQLREVHEGWFEARPAGSSGRYRIYRRNPVI